MADARIELAGSAAFGTTNGGTQDFTIPGFGTPKAVIVFYSNSDDGEGFANGAVGMGFSDGTNEYSVQGITRDNKAAGSSARSLDTLLVHLRTVGDVEYATFSFDSWVTDGVRIVSNMAHAADRMLSVILIGGTDVAEVAVGNHAIAAGSTHHNVGAGFPASLLFSLDARRTISTTKWASNFIVSLGIAHDNGASVDQRSIYSFDDDGSATTAITHALSETNLHHTYNIANATNEEVQVASFSTTGVNYTKTASAATFDYPYLAIRFTNDPDIKLYTEDMPVATGSFSSTGPGFEPTSLLFLESQKTTVGASSQDMTAGIASLNTAAGASIGVSSEDGLARTNTRGHGSITGIRTKDPTGGLQLEATLTSMDASGYTLDVTTAEATARKWVALAIGAGGGSVVIPEDISQGQTIDNMTLTQSSVLAVNDISQSQTIDGVTLTQAGILAPADIDQSQSIDNVTITQAHIIAIDDIGQDQSIDGVSLTQSGILAVLDISQSQLIDNASLSQSGALSADDIAQSQLIDGVTLAQANVLVVDDIGQLNSIDNVTLSVAGSLAVQAITQGQTIDGVSLTQAHSLVVDDLGQSQSIDNVALVQHYQLAVADLLQSQTIDNVTLSVSSLVLSIDDISQNQSIDPAAITEHAVLSVSNLTQSQIIDIVSLGGLVIGELRGNLVMYALVDGQVTASALIDGQITSEPLLTGTVATLH